MNDLPFFNWSIKKTLNSLSDPIEKAKIKVFYFIFILNFPKIFISIYDHIANQKFHLITGGIKSLLITLIILKLLLARPKYITILIHIAQLFTAYYIYKTIFKIGIDIFILQHIFMAIAFSFYGLGKKWGIIYSSINIITLVSFLIVNDTASVAIISTSTRFSSHAYIINVMLNFIVIAVSHYYFHSALFNTIKEKKELNKSLKKTAKDKTDFLSTMSHEIRTPLNAVIGMTNLLIENKPSPDQKENLDVLKFSAENLLSIINNILDINKIESDKVQLENIPFNLKSLISNAWAIFKPLAQKKELNYTLLIDENITDSEVYGDPTRLTQIITNLTNNALKFTNTGSVSISAFLIKDDEKTLSIRISIKDTGIGISQDQHTSIFDPFIQASSATTRNFGGTGLGLPIVKNLLIKYKSEINIESEPGKGSNFYFDLTFPKVISKNNNETSITIKPSAAIQNIKILLAEDNEMNTIFMRKLLSTRGLTIDVAGNGMQAIEMIEKNDYDIILMDLNMPIMNGLEATKTIRNMSNPQKANVKIIALTASVSEEIKTDIFNSGMDDYISKPFDPEELFLKLEEVAFAKV